MCECVCVSVCECEVSAYMCMSVHGSGRDASFVLTSFTSHSASLPDVLRFDNTYSWTRTKEVHYSVLLHPPDLDLPDPAATPVHQTVSSGDKAATEREPEEEDAFEDALEGVESQGSNPAPSLVQGGEGREGWMSEAAAVVTTLPSTSTEI